MILMPADAPALKRAATEGYGAEVVEFDRYADDREQLVRELAARARPAARAPLRRSAGDGGSGDGRARVAGRRSTAVDASSVPVGGGGLHLRLRHRVAALAPGTRVIGVEPEASDDVARSLASGRRERVDRRSDDRRRPADGIARRADLAGHSGDCRRGGDRQRRGDRRRDALLFERMKLVVEPSGASAFAALLAGKLGVTGLRVGRGAVRRQRRRRRLRPPHAQLSPATSARRGWPARTPAVRPRCAGRPACCPQGRADRRG